MIKKDFEVVAQIVTSLSYHLKDGCFIVGDGNARDALLIEEIQNTVNNILEKQNKNYSPEKFWNAVYKRRQEIIDIINNA